MNSDASMVRKLEKLLLGLMLLEPHRIPAVLDTMCFGHLYGVKNQFIFQGIERSHERCGTAGTNIITVSEELAQMGLLGDAVPHEDVAELVERVDFVDGAMTSVLAGMLKINREVQVCLETEPVGV